MWRDDHAPDLAYGVVERQNVCKENVMTQQCLSILHRRAFARLAFAVCNPRRAFRTLAILVLAGVACLGAGAPVQAQHTVPPFGIPCDSDGPAGTAYVPGVNCRLMDVDGYIRRYVVWVPLANVPAHPPAVFMLHGGSGTGEQFLRRSGWRQKATQEGFVAIFPTAVPHFVLEHRRFSTHWNHYGLPHDIDPTRRPAGYPATAPWPADDVAFIRQITDDLRTHLAIDEKRVYVAGFSSGGQMCARLGVELSQVIAAVACHTGGLREVHKTLVGHRNLSAYFSLGTLDDNALEAINTYRATLGQQALDALPLDPAALKRLPYLNSHLLVTAESLNLEAIPMTVSQGAGWTELRAETPQAGNLDGNVFYFGLFDGVTHEYPNGTNNTDFGFNMPDWVWPFFEQHPLP
jgi:poly(3-hydroxybutyrate) depolymerase